jgi:hypothetical protein
MLPIRSPTRKRTFEESVLGDQQVENGTSSTDKGHKIARVLQSVNSNARKASLDSIPTELLRQISSYLSTSEFLSLRVTNRAIEVKLFNEFAVYYFAKKQFMLTAKSL